MGLMPESLMQSGWRFPESAWQAMSEYERGFAQAEFSGMRTLKYYRRRLDWMGFTGGGAVLDAACGMGQWSVALAERYSNVWGVDLDSGRLRVATGLAAGHESPGLAFARSRMEALPFSNGSFDAVFCYGAVMFADVGQALAEFSRVLRPGGRLYVNANAWGWCAHLVLDRGVKGANANVLRMGVQTGLNTLLGRRRNIFVPAGRMQTLLMGAGFRICHVGPEGSSLFGSGEKPDPAYRPSFYGLQSMVEAIAVKGGASCG